MAAAQGVHSLVRLEKAWCVLIELWHTPKIAGLSGICERINHQP